MAKNQIDNINNEKGGTININNPENSNLKYYIFGISIIILIALFFKDTSSSKTINTTNGSNSPSISTNSGDVSVNYNTINNNEDSSPKFELLSQLDLSGFKKVKTITKKEIPALLDSVFTFEEYDSNEAIIVKLVSDNDKYGESVVTCRRYNYLLNRGYYAPTGWDMKFASRLNKSCETLRYLLLAEKASKSYIKPLKWNRETLKYLPMDLTASASLLGEVADKNLKRIYDLKDRVKVIKQEGFNLENNVNICFEIDNSNGMCLESMAKADINQDGIEDLIVFMGVYAVEGSFSYGSVIILTRFSDNEMYQVIS